MKQKIIILHAQKWSFTDEKTGEFRKGTTIYYLLTDTLKSCTGQNGNMGYAIAKASIPDDLVAKLISVPGIYDAEFNLQSYAGGKVAPKLTSIDYIKNFI